MTNEGTPLTQDMLKKYGFEQEISEDNDGDEIKTWFKNGIELHEDSWWIIKGESIYAEGGSCYGSKEPEITFSFATRVREDGSFKSGWNIATDTQLQNLVFSLTGKSLELKSCNYFNEKLDNVIKSDDFKEGKIGVEFEIKLKL